MKSAVNIVVCMRRLPSLLGLSVLLASAFLEQANAQGIDPLIEGAKLCTRPLQRYERENGIPSHLLSAIASTESGRYHDGLKIKLPWPWTINAEGKGYYFNTKEEAITAAHNLQRKGIQSMDLGCMQVNIMHHPRAFSSLSEAFDPEHNVAYAAGFLRDLYQEEGSWKQAAGDYHSKTPKLGKEYVGQVYNSWYRIVDKLRAARLNVPESSVNGLRDMAKADVNADYSSRIQAAKFASAVKPSPKTVVVAKQGRESSSYKYVGTKTVTVASSAKQAAFERSRHSDIIVVKPRISVVSAGSSMMPVNQVPQPMVMASASEASQAGKVGEPQQAKIIRIDNKLADRRPANVEPVKKSGPNFIFND